MLFRPAPSSYVDEDGIWLEVIGRQSDYQVLLEPSGKITIRQGVMHDCYGSPRDWKELSFQTWCVYRYESGKNW